MTPRVVRYLIEHLSRARFLRRPARPRLARRVVRGLAPQVRSEELRRLFPDPTNQRAFDLCAAQTNPAEAPPQSSRSPRTGLGSVGSQNRASQLHGAVQHVGGLPSDTGDVAAVHKPPQTTLDRAADRRAAALDRDRCPGPRASRPPPRPQPAAAGVGSGSGPAHQKQSVDRVRSPAVSRAARRFADTKAENNDG